MIFGPQAAATEASAVPRAISPKAVEFTPMILRDPHKGLVLNGKSQTKIDEKPNGDLYKMRYKSNE
jgi:hypothetical protein